MYTKPLYRPLSRIGQLLESLAKHKTHHWKEQTKISKWTKCQSHIPKHREAPSFWKFQFLFCMVNGQALPDQETCACVNDGFTA